MCTIPVSHFKKKIILWIAPRPFAEPRFETQGSPASCTPYPGSITRPWLPSLGGRRRTLPSGSRENPESAAFSVQRAVLRIACPSDVFPELYCRLGANESSATGSCAFFLAGDFYFSFSTCVPAVDQSLFSL